MKDNEYKDWSKTELIKEIKKLEKRKKYGVVWENKPEKVAELCKEKLPILEEDTKKEIKADSKRPVNVLIEGDNYHALSVLNYTHKGKVDLIYIDPPYNTGKNDFTYNDRFVEIEDTYRHSKWLSFMEKRLNLAKKLLKNSGFIFISIDDNEQAQLKILCDEIFGQKNFVTYFIWNKKTGRQNDAKFVSTNHEYVLCYSKKIKFAKFNLIPRTEKANREFKNLDNDKRGLWIHRPLHAKSGSESSRYEIKFPNGVVWKPPVGTYHRFSKQKLMNMYEDNRIWFGKTGKNVPRYKRFFSEVKQGIIPNTLLMAHEVGNTQKAKQDYQKYVLNVNFDNPKPIGLIKHFLILGSKNNSTVLDFFSGSGTTAQAVLEMNNENKDSNRSFILCTNDENNICTEICYPRIKNVLAKVKIKSNLKYLKADFVDAKPTDKNKKKMVRKSTEMLCLKEECFNEVKKSKYFKIFKNSQDKYLGIIYDDDGIKSLKKEIKKINRQFVVYVFSFDESTKDEEFEDIINLVDLRPIPAAILNVYRRIFR